MERFNQTIEELYQEMIQTGSQQIPCRELRDQGMALFREKGIPHGKMEKWRHKAIDTLLVKPDQPFRPYRIQTEPSPYQPIDQVFKCEIKNIGTISYHLLNGWYVHQNKPLDVWENGVIVGSINAAYQQFPELVKKHFNQLDPEKQDGLIALNQALFTDGVFIYVPDNVVVETPIQIVSLVDTLQKLMIQHHHLVIVGKNSQLSLVHCNDSVHEENSFINNILEINLEANAQLHYYKMENKDAQSILVNNTFVNQAADSRFTSNMITFNCGYVRNSLEVHLNEEGADANLYGLYLVDRKQYIDNQVNIVHHVPHCTSNQIYKGIADDEAGANFSGHIYVAKDAQQTAAYQINRNIALTDEAKITTRPFLEIYADDVKCSHGATIGQLDENAMFYLRTRGICLRNARMLLMFAFANEIANLVLIEKLRERLNDMIKRRLSGELTICDQCMMNCADKENLIYDIDTTRLRS